MKKLILSILLLFSSGSATAQLPEYALRAMNFRLNPASSSEMEFDVYLQHTNPGTAVFEYVQGGYFFSFNPYIALNAGELQISIVNSEVLQMFQPRIVNGSVVPINDPKQYALRLAVNTMPGSGRVFTVPSSVYPGTLMFTLRIRRINGPFLSNNFGIRWRHYPPNNFNSRTRIFGYVNEFTVGELTNPANHFVDTSGINGSGVPGLVYAEQNILIGGRYHDLFSFRSGETVTDVSVQSNDYKGNSGENPQSHVKLSESFSGTEFPPEGWSTIKKFPGVGSWYRTTYNPRSTPGGIESDYSPSGGCNYIVTRRFVPGVGDSLAFYFSQFYHEVYNDSFEVLISSRDSLLRSFDKRLLLLRDGHNYPPAGTWGKFHLDLTPYAGKTVWIAFKHSDMNGENIRIDDVTVGRLPAHRISVEMIEPKDTVSTEDSLVSITRITNTGSESIPGPIYISQLITGPVNLTLTERVDNLPVGESKYIYFDTIALVLDTGAYRYKIVTSVPLARDSAEGRFHVSPRNWGSNGNIWWANSEPGGYPFPFRRPRFAWRDTAGSVSLFVNGILVSDRFVGHTYGGNLMYGYFDLGNILNADTGGRCIRIDGKCFTGIYPTVDGVIGLTSDSTPPLNISSEHPAYGLPSPALYALWTNLTLKAAEVNRLSYRLDTAQNELLICWDRVHQSGFDRVLSFQACIELKRPGDESNSNFRFSYSDTTLSRTSIGFLNEYSNYNFGNYGSMSEHFIGYNNALANSAAYYRYRRGYGYNRSFRTGPMFQAPGKSSLSVEFGPDPSYLTRFDNADKNFAHDENSVPSQDINRDGIVDGSDLSIAENCIAEIHECELYRIDADDLKAIYEMAFTYTMIRQ